jgi:hypothetical protein
MPPQCDGKPQNGNNKKNKLSSLSLNNLLGAFLVLLVGLSLSLLAFLGEKIHAAAQILNCKKSQIIHGNI